MSHSFRATQPEGRLSPEALGGSNRHQAGWKNTLHTHTGADTSIGTHTFTSTAGGVTLGTHTQPGHELKMICK